MAFEKKLSSFVVNYFELYLLVVQKTRVKYTFKNR